MAIVVESNNQFSQSDCDLLIGGRWHCASNDARFELFDPSTGDVTTQAADASLADFEHAIELADAAVYSAAWRQCSAAERGRLLWAISEKILDSVDDLAELEAADSGRPINVTRGIDVPMAAQVFQILSGWCTMHAADTERISGDSVLLASRSSRTVPGTHLLVPNADFPLLSCAAFLAPSLAVGGAALIALIHCAPRTSLRLGELCQQVGVPDGVVNLLTASTPEVLRPLTQNPLVQFIDIDGDAEFATEIAALATSHQMRSRVRTKGWRREVILSDADLDVACRTTIDSLFLAADQNAFSKSEIWIEPEIYDEVTQRLNDLLADLCVGDASNPATQIGPVLNQQIRLAGEQYLAANTAAGIGVIGRELANNAAGGFFVPPRVYVDSQQWATGSHIEPPARSVRLGVYEREKMLHGAQCRNGACDALGVWTSDRATAVALAEQSQTKHFRLNFVPGERHQDLCDFYTHHQFSKHELVRRTAAMKHDMLVYE